MRSIKSTLGGACSVLGKTLMGMPVASLIAGQPPSQVMVYIWMAGFIIDAAGSFLATIFSADKSDVRRLMEDSDISADKRFVTKEDNKTMLSGKQDVEDK